MVPRAAKIAAQGGRGGPRIGVIADDVTGAADVASGLAGFEVSTVLLVGVPASGRLPNAAAIVVGLRSRAAAVDRAVADSLATLEILRTAGVRRVLSKVCSTFDSGPRGNIGPVADACLQAMGQDRAVVCPANPANGRTVYQGHLFVFDRLLSETSMRTHPLTPMRDADIRRVLARQTSGRVGHLPHEVVRRGPRAVRTHLRRLADDEVRFVVADATGTTDLDHLARACIDEPFLVVAAGLTAALVPVWRAHHVLPPPERASAPAPAPGRAAILAGSCSSATIGQLAAASVRMPVWHLDPLAVARDELATVESALAWAAAQPGPLIIASTADAEHVAAAQGRLGRRQAGSLLERAFGVIARGLVTVGIRRLVVAGGETSGAVLAALEVDALRIGPAIEPGVPWARTLDGRDIAFVLKSGNFGSRELFLRTAGVG